MFYIYEITNNINCKTYIGQRKCPINKLPETDKYMGSGVILKQAFEKYGKENFSKTILAITETQENINILEKVFIALYRAGGKAEYNVCDGGQIRFSGEIAEKIYDKISKSHKGKKLSEEHKLKISKSGIGKHFKDEECKKKISLKNKGRKFSEEFKENCRIRNLGKHLSEEHKLKISLAMKGVKKTPEHIKNASQARIGCKYKPMSELARKHISESHKGKKHSEESKRKMSEKAKLRYARLRENGNKQNQSN